jgi:hypothetical protein
MERMSVPEESLVVRVPDVLSTEVSGRMVLLTGELRYLGLDRVSEAIWALLEEPMTVDAVVDHLVQRFDVSADECRADVLGFLHDLERHRAVTIG